MTLQMDSRCDIAVYPGEPIHRLINWHDSTGKTIYLDPDRHRAEIHLSGPLIIIPSCFINNSGGINLQISPISTKLPLGVSALYELIISDLITGNRVTLLQGKIHTVARTFQQGKHNSLGVDVPGDRVMVWPPLPTDLKSLLQHGRELVSNSKTLIADGGYYIWSAGTSDDIDLQWVPLTEEVRHALLRAAGNG